VPDFRLSAVFYLAAKLNLFFMRKIFLNVFVFCFAIQLISAQNEDRIYPVAEWMPSLPGCEKLETAKDQIQCTKDKVNQFLEENLEYPGSAKREGKEGMAVVSFVVERNGKISNVTLKTDPGFGMGREALRVVKKMKTWNPGMVWDKKVRVEYKIPVTFALEKSSPPESIAASAEEKDNYKDVDEMPRFQGCEAAEAKEAEQCTYEKLVAYLQEHMKYPEKAKTEKIEGTVNTRFVIDEAGNLTLPEVLNGLGGGCDEEALRLLSEMPVWTPGKKDGKAVKVEMALPFRFKLGPEGK
jgi:TonB family protein